MVLMGLGISVWAVQLLIEGFGVATATEQAFFFRFRKFRCHL